MVKIPFLPKYINNNKYTSLAIDSFLGGLAYTAATKVPKMIFDASKSLVRSDITISNEESGYMMVLEYITREIIGIERVRSIGIDVDVGHRYDDDMMKSTAYVSRANAVLGFGIHRGTYKGHRVLVERTRVTGPVTRAMEFTEIQVYGLGRKIAQELVRDAIAHVRKQFESDAGVCVYGHSSGSWTITKSLPRRGPETLFLAGDEYTRIYDHIAAFDAKRDWYMSKGLNHHTGILLYGLPGTAKTSLAQVIAAQTGRSIYNLNLSAIELDSELEKLISDRKIDWNKSILLIEDADATNANLQDRENMGSDKSKSGISLATILNALDGIGTPEDLVVIATTNHKDKLDPALVRPGRFDLSIEMQQLHYDQVKAMAVFYEVDDTVGPIHGFVPMSGAQARAMLLEGGMQSIRDYQHDQKRDTIHLVGDTRD